MTWPPLLVVWLCWGLSYPFMAWTLEAVDLITARLLANAGAGTLLLLLCLLALRGRLLGAEHAIPAGLDGVAKALHGKRRLQTLLRAA